LIIEASFPLFQEEVKVVIRDAVVSSEMAFRLVPKVLDAIDVVPIDRKNLGLCDNLS
jgi:hypothetical protein